MTDPILRQVKLEEGRRIVADARARFMSRERMAERFASYDSSFFRDLRDAPLLEIHEQLDNIADLVVRYRFYNGTSIVGKFFLPVLKGKPDIGFRGLDDRGQGIDRRMSIFRELIPTGTKVGVPKVYLYDPEDRVVWMEDIGEVLLSLGPQHWDRWLMPLGKALGTVHRYEVPDSLVPDLEDELRRNYLIRYPARYLEPFLDMNGRRDRWQRFLAIDASCRHSLIHGDLAPKNCVVTQDDQLWLLDFERSNLGNPAYDVGLMIAHLLIMAWDRGSEDVLRPVEIFWKAYREQGLVWPEFTFCVRSYLALILAYRLHSLYFIQTTNPQIRRRIEASLLKLLDSPVDPESTLNHPCAELGEIHQ